MFALEGKLLPGVAVGDERFVVWSWRRSPVGPVAAVGRVGRGGGMTLYTSTPAYADLLRVWHRVDEVRTGAVRLSDERGRFLMSALPAENPAAEPLDLDLEVGATLATRALNLTLALTLPFVRRSALFVRATGPVAGALLGIGPGRRSVGRTETGVEVRIATHAVTAVLDARARLGGKDLGGLRPADDSPDWGEIKMPRRPYLLDCTFVVDAPCPRA